MRLSATVSVSDLVRRPGEEAGELTTQPFRFAGDRLFVNADASRPGASVAVEVLGEDGTPLAGYEAAACRVIRSDTLAPGGDGWVRVDRPG